MKLCPKLILEGTRLTHKTDIAFALNEHPRVVGPRRYRYHSPLISAEWCAFTNVPWGRGPDQLRAAGGGAGDGDLRHLGAALRAAALLLLDRGPLPRLDDRATSGASTAASYDFGWLEERLLPLGFRLVLCTRRPESFERAREERLKVSGNPGQYDDLAPFVAEQEDMRFEVGRSLPAVVRGRRVGRRRRRAPAIASPDWLGGRPAASPWPRPDRPRTSRMPPRAIESAPQRVEGRR